ncbi:MULTISPECIES: OsmC family protein [unclassified Rhizobium]|uniref:OsmC family protein n=1 Tax=unclassified Rhizobium TaxID=2613769 RepID=UPI0038252C0B
MSAEHKITASWKQAPHPSKPNTYSRNLMVDFGHNIVVGASASPDYLGDASLPDPEQLFLSSLSSCHMLSFLAIAEMRGCKVVSYYDEASAYLEKDQGALARVKRVVLRPRVEFDPSGKIPDRDALEKMHDKAHDICFIARSVTTGVSVEPDRSE